MIDVTDDAVFEALRQAARERMVEIKRRQARLHAEVAESARRPPTAFVPEVTPTRS